MEKEKKLINYLRNKGGIASYAEIIEAGFNKIIIRDTLNSGRIQKINRGLYKLSSGITLSNPDLVSVALEAPEGVICLLSALSYHELTDEIPKYVDAAIPRGHHANIIKYPPVHFYRFSSKTWSAGITKYDIGGHEVKIYNIAKTIADCFKFRSKIGINVAREALKTAVREKGEKPARIMKYAKLCRVTAIVQPILEAMI
ncbi:transcriptional regulator [bacterium]|nr:transcriptional regulator [bacterium]MBU4123589.1 transcriptional regulator [bacterium]